MHRTALVLGGNYMGADRFAIPAGRHLLRKGRRPLRADGGEVTRALGCVVTDGAIGRQPRRLAITAVEHMTLTGYADAGVTHEMQEKLAHPDNLIGRAGRMEDIANAMLYLASPASSWVSGQIINVHGGGHVTRLFGE